MAKFIFIIIAISVLLFEASAQATRVLKKRYPRSRQNSEVFEVLRNNKNVKHGAYKKYFKLQGEEYRKFYCSKVHPDNYLKTSGNYHLGKRHGEWVEYSAPGKVRTFGKYELGKKTGIWYTLKEDGKVVERMDFDNGIKLEPEIVLPFIFDRNQIDEYFQGDIHVVMNLDQSCTIENFELLYAVDEESIVSEVGKMMKEKERLLKQYQKSCTPGSKSMVIHFGLE